jgi:hypothetical protein
MINKNKYREYLIGKMERQTPVFDKIDSIALTTPATPKIKPLHPVRRWLVPTVSSILGVAIAFFSILGINIWVHTPAKQHIMTVEERNYMACRVYNSVVKNEENIPMAAYSWGANSPYRNDGGYSFSTLTVQDSFFIYTSFDTDFSPFVNEPDFKGSRIETVFAILDLKALYTDGREGHLYTGMMILHHNETTVGFLSCDIPLWRDVSIEKDKATFDDVSSATYASTMFLTPNEVVDEGGGIEDAYTVTIEGKHKTGFSISTDFITKKGEISPLTCSIDNSSYKAMGKEETINLIQASTVEKKTGNAIILDIDKSKWVLTVTSSELPSLKTIAFVKLQTNTTIYDYDLTGILSKGDTIAFDYYVRYANYQPTNLVCYTIRINK